MKDSAIQLVDIVQQFHKLASVGVMASASEWNELWRAMAAEQPEFVAWLQTIRGELMERNRNLRLKNLRKERNRFLLLKSLKKERNRLLLPKNQKKERNRHL